MPRKDDVAAMRSQVEGIVWCANWSQNDVSLIIPLDHFYFGHGNFETSIMTSIIYDHLSVFVLFLKPFVVGTGEETTSKVRFCWRWPLGDFVSCNAFFVCFQKASF